MTDKMLLEEFIAKKVGSYREPVREGTPKGDPIGLSAQKNLAALLMLQNTTHRERAEKAGVSHQLMRNWAAEDIFQERVSEYIREFSNHYYKKKKEQWENFSFPIVKRYVEDETKRDAKNVGLIDLPVGIIEKVDPDNDYAEPLFSAVVETLIDEIARVKNHAERLAWLILTHIATNARKKAMTEKVIRDEKDGFRDFVRDILLLPSWRKKAIKLAIIAISYLE